MTYRDEETLGKSDLKEKVEYIIHVLYKQGSPVEKIRQLRMDLAHFNLTGKLADNEYDDLTNMMYQYFG